jgi:DNA repair exonuclease SbcCD ATPase subunit
MRFIDLKAECAYSFEELHLGEEAFNSGGLTAIIGKNNDQGTANGAGKSNVLKIIYYLLFGKELNGESVEEISNRSLGRGHFGQLIFEDRGNKFKIQRFRDFKPEEGSILQAREGSKARLKGVRFFINDEAFGDKKANGEPMSDVETQNIILNRIGITPELFLMSVMTAQDAKANFLMAPDTKKKDIISELLDLEAYERAYSQVREDIEGMEKQAGQAEMQVEEINRESLAKLGELEGLRAKEAGFRQAIEKEVADAQGRFLKSEGEYRQLKKARPEAIDAASAELELRQKEDEIRELASAEVSLETEEIKALEAQIADCEATLKKIEGDESRCTGQLQLLASAKAQSATKEAIQAQIAALRELALASPESPEALLAAARGEEAKADALQAEAQQAAAATQAILGKKGRVEGQLQGLAQRLEGKAQAALSLKEAMRAGGEALARLADAEDELSLGMMLAQAQERIAALALKKGEIEFRLAQNAADAKGLLSSEDCPTCGRPWDEEHKGEREKKAKAFANAKRALASELLSAAKSLKAEEAAASLAEKAASLLALRASLRSIEALEAQAQGLEAQKAELEGEAAARESQAKSLQSAIAALRLSGKEKAQGAERARAARDAMAKIAELESELALEGERAARAEGLKAQADALARGASRVRAVLNSLMKKRSLELDRVRQALRQAQEHAAKLNQEAKALALRVSQARVSAQRVAQWEAALAAAFEKLELLTEQVGQIRQRTNPYVEIIERAEGRVEELASRKGQLMGRVERIQEELKYLNFWKNGFGPTGIRSFLSDEVVVHLNEISRDYLSDLFDGAISVVFESESVSQKGGVSNKISTKFYLNGKESPLGLLSGGERQRIVLAVDLALSDIAESRTGTKINLKFMDEPFNGIDGNGQLKSIALFSKIAKRRSGFFIITHDERFQALCQHTIFVVKKDEVSRIASREQFQAAAS